MLELETKAIHELEKAFNQDILTHFVTQNKYTIEENSSYLYIRFNEFVFEIHINFELTKYFKVMEIDQTTKEFGKTISHFSLDKFFTPEMSVKVLHRVIVELDKTYPIVGLNN